MKSVVIPVVLFAAIGVGESARGGGGVLHIMGNQAVWLDATGATMRDPFPNLGVVPTPWAHDGMTFTLGPGASGFTVGTGNATDWTEHTAGHDIAISGPENFNIDLARPVFSIGFEFVEPEFDPNVNAPFAESTFRVKVYSGVDPIGTVFFELPNDSLQFVGLHSDTAFDRVEFFELIGNNENEFFGQFWTGDRALGACPEDINGDGAVDFADLNILLGDFNTTGAGLPGDIDGDGDVDFADLNALLGVFNTEC